MKRLFLFILMIFASQIATAQKYVIEPLFTDSVEVSGYKNDKPDYSVSTYLSRGTEVNLVKLLPHYEASDTANATNGKKMRAVISVNNNRYVLQAINLVFSPNNKASVDNPLAKYKMCPNTFFGFVNWDPRSEEGQLLCSTKIPLTVFYICIVLFIIMLTIDYMGHALQKIMMIIIPVLLLVCTGLEAGYLYLMGNEYLWWCSKEYFGVWGSLWRTLPFGLVVYVQIAICNKYTEFLDIDGEISIKPIIIMTIIFIPLVIVVAIVTSILKSRGVEIGMDWETLQLIIIFGTLAVFLCIALFKNIRSFGLLMGIMLTIFSIVFVIGFLATAFGLIYLLFGFVLRIIVPVLGFFFLYAVMHSVPAIIGSDGHRYTRDSYGNYRGSDGGTYRRLD